MSRLLQGERAKWLVVALGTGAVIGGSVAAAGAAGVNVPLVHPSDGGATIEQKVDVTSPAVLDTLGDMFSEPAVSGAVAQKLRDAFAVFSESPAAKADFDGARLVESNGVGAYVVPSGQEVCLILTLADGKPGGGSCNTLDEVKDGATFVATRMRGEKTRFAFLVADGQPAPVLVRGDGSKSSLKVVDNVAAGVLDVDAKVVPVQGKSEPVTAAPEVPKR